MKHYVTFIVIWMTFITVLLLEERKTMSLSLMIFHSIGKCIYYIQKMKH